MERTKASERLRVAVVDNTKYRAIIAPDELSLMSLVRKHVTFCKEVKSCLELVMRRDHVFISSKCRRGNNINYNKSFYYSLTEFGTCKQFTYASGWST